MDMEKISGPQIAGMLKTSSAVIRELSEENQQLRTKVAHFEKKERAEKIASQMAEKELQPELSHSQKVAGLMQRDNLDVVEQAVDISAPQMKLASIDGGSGVEVEGGMEGSQAEAQFAAALATD